MSKKFVLEITRGNEAMQSVEDVAEALVRVSERVAKSSGLSKGVIADLNGNTVGHWEFKTSARRATSAKRPAKRKATSRR